MKYLLPVLYILPSLAMANLDIPRGVYLSDQMEEAASEAQSEGKALAFVYSDSNST